MTLEQFNAAMKIISRNHSTVLKINMPKNHFAGKLGADEFTIHIDRCCSSVTKNLLAAGFDLQMDEHGLEVFKI